MNQPDAPKPEEAPGTDPLQELLKQEEELRAKMAELQAARARLEAEARAAEDKQKREEEAARPLVVTVTYLNGATLFIENKWRADIVDLYRATPGHIWHSYLSDGKTGRNAIPLASWTEFYAKLLVMPNVTLRWANKDLEAEISWYLGAPPWEIVMHPSNRHFICSMGPRQAQWLLSDIPGADWDLSSKSWKVTRMEGWRIAKNLKGIEGVVWEPEAAEIIFEQIKARASMDELAAKEDSDIIDTLLPHLLPRLRALRPKMIFDDGRVARPFQRVGIEFLFKSGGSVALGDDTGLGKTLQGILLAEILRKTKPDLLVLCVVKAGNIPNWQREIKLLTGSDDKMESGLDALVCKGTKPDGWDLMKVVQRKVSYVIVSYNTLGSYIKGTDNDGIEQDQYLWANTLSMVKPDLVLLDEAHMIKNPDSHMSRAARKLVTAERRIPMTATFILNRAEEWWPNLFMLDPETFRVHDQYVNTYTINGKHPRRVEELNELLRPRFLRRKKLDVLKDLPAINRINVWYDLSDKAKKLYDMVLAGIYEELDVFDPSGKGGTQMNVMSMLAKFTRLRQVCAADKAKEFTPDFVTDLKDQHPDDPGKVLIFSQFKGSALAIARRLGNEAVCTVKAAARGTKGDAFISMTPKERDALFESARHDSSVKYVVTTAHPATGLEGHNIEYCKWVVFNDPFWTPAAHDQCEGRAYGRLANPHPIDSFYILADTGSGEADIERIIMAILEKKLAIIQASVDSVEASRAKNENIIHELIAALKAAMWARSGKR